MDHLIQVVTDNQGLFIALGALALSELLPFLKGTKWNGIAQGLLSLLKKKQAG